jgi:hypothetical protein
MTFGYGYSPLFSPSAMPAAKSVARNIERDRFGGVVAADQGEDGELERELELAMSEGELPVASSDVDVPPDTSFRDDDDDDDEESATPHWSIGLPPSSPPPSSSPILAPQADVHEQDVDHLAVLSSENDNGISEHDYIPFETAPPFSSDAEDLTSMFLVDDLSTIFPDSYFPPTLDAVNGLSSFGNLDGDDAGAAVVQNGVDDFDFTEFWESVKPLVGVGEGVGDVSSTVGGAQGVTVKDPVDHARLAEEVKALFEGCLV